MSSYLIYFSKTQIFKQFCTHETLVSTSVCTVSCATLKYTNAGRAAHSVTLAYKLYPEPQPPRKYFNNSIKKFYLHDGDGESWSHKNTTRNFMCVLMGTTPHQHLIMKKAGRDCMEKRRRRQRAERR